MHFDPGSELYSPADIARAANVPVDWAVRAAGSADARLTWAEAVRLGRLLATPISPSSRAIGRPELFSNVVVEPVSHQRAPFLLSSTAHIGIAATAFFIASLGYAPRAATSAPIDPNNTMRLVFMTTPGPGGGGGGGGHREPAPAPKALRQGHHALNSPVPARTAPELPKPTARPEPPPLKAEPLPPIVAPVIAAPSDSRDRPGVLEPSPATADSHGQGTGGGAGTGTGTGAGSGEGAGIGPGSGGGIGGGPYRPGSGIEPPRVLREVKADYTEDARRQHLEGEVVVEIVVRRDGSVGDVKLRHGLGAGLDARAIDAVRQWRFAPALRQGVPVDVLVEVAVEFRLR